MFVSSLSRDYFGVESTAFLPAIKLKKNYPMVRWTGKYIFPISEAIKIAVSFSKFQCLCAMLLLRDGFTVASYKLQSRN